MKTTNNKRAQAPDENNNDFSLALGITTEQWGRACERAKAAFKEGDTVVAMVNRAMPDASEYDRAVVCALIAHVQRAEQIRELIARLKSIGGGI